jgi:hypothetical protein
MNLSLQRTHYYRILLSKFTKGPNREVSATMNKTIGYAPMLASSAVNSGIEMEFRSLLVLC